jgi:phosphotransferase system enzyme I (PtsI)
VIGRAFLLDSEEFRIPRRFITAEEIPSEVERYHRAVAEAGADLKGIKERFARLIGSKAADIFEAHVWMLEDPRVRAEVERYVREQRHTPEYAVSRVFRRYVRLFRNISDGYLKQRVSDVYDAENRLLRHLLGAKLETMQNLTEPVVVVAHDLTPSMTASLDRKKVLGFATDAGGQTSHTAIVARALEIPAVVGLADITTEVSGRDPIIIDGNRGIVILNPDADTVKKYEALERNFHYFERRLTDELHNLPSETKDGHRVRLLVNIELPEEIPSALACGADGVGLYRTEFLCVDREDVSEEEHFEAYQRAVSLLQGRSLCIRTQDLGGEKIFGRVEYMKEPNPMLGCRSIRRSFRNMETFRRQLRAVCRVSALGPVEVMFPMIASVEEVRKAVHVLRDVQKKLKRKGLPYDENMKVGIMIEVPSAVVIADLLAHEVDFFSIGTNDLIQYTLAVDRVNEQVADLYQPAHPAILRMIRQLIEMGKQHQVPVSMCGEMSGDILYVLLLLGLGLEVFSMVPAMIPEVKKIVRSVTLQEAKELADQVMRFTDVDKTVTFLKDRTSRILPEAF